MNDQPKGYPWHPLAMKYRLLTGEAKADLEADILANGQREDIVLHDGMVLEGRNRQDACLAVGIEPRYRQWGSREGDGTDPGAFVYSLNNVRRDQSWSEHIAAKRLEERRVAALRAEGKSFRAIATEIGKSKSHVARVVADSTVPSPGTVTEATEAPAAPDKVVGLDGRTQPSTRRKVAPTDPQAARLRRLLRDLPAYYPVCTPEVQSATDVLLNLLSSPSHRAD